LNLLGKEILRASFADSCYNRRMNKVRKVGAKVDIVMEGMYRLAKYKWQCTVCNKVYLMQWDAKKCNHKEWREVKGLGSRQVNVMDGKVDYCSGDVEYLERLKQRGVKLV